MNTAELDRALGLISKAGAIIVGVQNDEQERFVNLSNDEQHGDEGEKINDATESLDAALVWLDAAIKIITPLVPEVAA